MPWDFLKAQSWGRCFGMRCTKGCSFRRVLGLLASSDDITQMLYSESMEKIELTAANSISLLRFRKLGLPHHKTELVVVNIRETG